MKTYISILRGINVTGHNMIKMDTLRNLYSQLNFKNILTYIQSGNVIFQTEKTHHEDLEKKISRKIFDIFGFEVPVIIIDLDYLKNVLNNNPFVNNGIENQNRLYVTFLSQEPDQANIDKIKEKNYGQDEYIIIGKTIYLFIPISYGNSKLSNTFFESKLKVVATTRNWKTVNELAKIAEEISKNND